MKSSIDYESYRKAFESYIIENFHCPQGRGQFTRKPSGEYTKVCYDRNDSTGFAPIQYLWHAYKTGIRIAS